MSVDVNVMCFANIAAEQRHTGKRLSGPSQSFSLRMSFPSLNTHKPALCKHLGTYDFVVAVRSVTYDGKQNSPLHTACMNTKQPLTTLRMDSNVYKTNNYVSTRTCGSVRMSTQPLICCLNQSTSEIKCEDAIQRQKVTEH